MKGEKGDTKGEWGTRLRERGTRMEERGPWFGDRERGWETEGAVFLAAYTKTKESSRLHTLRAGTKIQRFWTAGRRVRRGTATKSGGGTIKPT